jgi:hypothetical protein
MCLLLKASFMQKYEWNQDVNLDSDYGPELTSSGKIYFSYFPYISHLFEVLEPDLM